MTRNWTDGRVLVAGLGVSGAAAARALASRGARVDVIEAGHGPAAAERAAGLAARGVHCELDVAFDDPSLLDGVDLVVPSPGIAQSSPLLAGALERGIPVWSEPELAWRLAAGATRLIAVTGTNGKTTTTELLAALLDAPVGGNIGTPLTDLLAVDPPPALVVAELSSFQLRFTEQLAPDVTVLLNVAPDHLDWHGDLDAYVAAKARAWTQSGADSALVVGDDAGARRAVTEHPARGRVVQVTGGVPEPGQVGVAEHAIASRLDGALEPIADLGDLALQGRHNVANACAAVAAALVAGAEPGDLAGPLKAFSPGPHRLALVARRGGVSWIDDSKATNPHAAAAALAACASSDEPDIVWIAGGLAKGLEFAALAEPVAAHVRHAVTIGTSGPDVAALARAQGVEVTEAGELHRAVADAAQLARPGETVLLAPACASMDQFVDYAARGRAFAAAVAALDAGGDRR